LVWFGVLDPNNFLLEKCISGIPFSCIDQVADANNDQIKFVIGNSLEKNIRISEISVRVQGTGNGCDGTGDATTPNGVTIAGVDLSVAPYTLGPGEQVEVALDCTIMATDLGEGNRARVLGEIFYIEHGSSFSKQSSVVVDVET